MRGPLPFLAGLAALLAAILITSTILVTGTGHAATGSPIWQVSITQFDKAGTLAGTPQTLTCPQSGCEQLITLDVLGKPRRFLLAVTIAARGAYVTLQAQDQDLGKVVEFEKGFVGPVFMAIHPGVATTVTLRFTLTGSAVSDPDQDYLTRNSRSLVFHRKMDPDLALRFELTPPPPEPPAAKPAG